MATVQPTALALVSKLSQKGCVVFTPSVQQKLAIANRAIRWLREQGAITTLVQLDGDVPTITVSGAAAPALKRIAYRESYRRLNDGHGTEMIVIQDCIVKWSDSKSRKGSDGKEDQ